MPSRFDLLIFDLGGVLVDWDPRHLYRDHFDDTAAMERFLAEVLTPEWNRQMDAGKPFADAVRELSAQHPAHAHHIGLWHTDWERTLAGALDASVALLRRLHRRGHRLVALSNWSAETFPVARRRFDFLTCFEDILVSGEHGVAKPDRAIFELACERWGVQPARALFIDDSPANVATARDMGFRAVHFTGPDILQRALTDLALLD